MLSDRKSFVIILADAIASTYDNESKCNAKRTDSKAKNKQLVRWIILSHHWALVILPPLQQATWRSKLVAHKQPVSPPRRLLPCRHILSKPFPGNRIIVEVQILFICNSILLLAVHIIYMMLRCWWMWTCEHIMWMGVSSANLFVFRFVWNLKKSSKNKNSMEFHWNRILSLESWAHGTVSKLTGTCTSKLMCKGCHDAKFRK